MKGINIWSGSHVFLAAALTNPTELSFRKGRIQNHYPVEFQGKVYPDAEAAYKRFRTGEIEQDMALMIKIIIAKLNQHPRLFEGIAECGGVAWLRECRHVAGVKNSRWEGEGINSRFILCLVLAYCLMMKVD